ncbi:MAG: efflux RND transporter periplasmic adaptor subunit [Proteobacteria bacterium]|nr:efflux RND transporter periplasmic adaptor subunit [Pseudomonadota bacterium]
MKLRYQFAITIALAALLGVGWLWLAGGQEAAGSKDAKSRGGGATRVLVENLTLATDRTMVRAVGTGAAHNSAAIHPSVSGEVVEVRFKAEQRVKTGDVLVRLDDQHQRLAVRLAEVSLRKATRDVARIEKLAKSGHASRNSLDTAQTELESARVRHAQAQADLADRAVVAPFSGVIGLTDISIGDRVTNATPIATLDERSIILVDFNLPEDYAAKLRPGSTVTVRPSTQPDRTITGTVTAMGSRIDEASRTLRIRAEIPNPDDSIRPGTSFGVEVAFTGRAYPSIPEVAVLWSRDGAYLWRAAPASAPASARGRGDSAGKDGKGATAEKVFVRLVSRDKGRILVDGKLAAGDAIVVEGVQGLRPGQRLAPQPFTGDARAAEAEMAGTGLRGPRGGKPGGQTGGKTGQKSGPKK